MSTTPRQALPGIPTGALTPQQQLEALRRVKAQAEQRVRLGAQLFKAAEAHTAQYQELLKQIKQEQAALREQLRSDMTRSFDSYDRWIGKVEQTTEARIKTMEEKIASLTTQLTERQGQIETLAKRAEALLDQTRCMMSKAQPRGLSTRPAPASASETTAPPLTLTDDPRPIGNLPDDLIYTQLLDKLRQPTERTERQPEADAA